MKILIAVVLFWAFPAWSAVSSLVVKYQGRSYSLHQLGTGFELDTDYQKEKLALDGCSSLRNFEALWTELENQKSAVTYFDRPHGKDEFIEYTYRGESEKVVWGSKLGQFLRELPKRFGAMAFYARTVCKKI